MNELPQNLNQISLEKKLDLIESFLNASTIDSGASETNEILVFNS
ncbi:hypothetical protein [Rurimicrobium arvi]|uniref:Uncharacterized protein n=1 Tax=Rurimicrobium arvi TaxID=2049916 RepID=A0ABP8MSX6_9BACT